jgi:hypothetical protein
VRHASTDVDPWSETALQVFITDVLEREPGLSALDVLNRCRVRAGTTPDTEQQNRLDRIYDQLYHSASMEELRRAERDERRLAEQLKRAGQLWMVPFLWILIIPIFTVPVQSVLVELMVVTEGLGCHWVYRQGALCPVVAVQAAYLPGLLNLAPLYWYRRYPSVIRTRQASILAATLGGVRYLWPTVGLALEAHAFQVSIRDDLLGVLPMVFPLGVVSFLLYVISVLVFGGFAIYVAFQDAEFGVGPGRSQPRSAKPY